MSFGTCLLFCQMIMTPIVFAVLYCGWHNIVPQWAGLTQSVVDLGSDFLTLDRYADASQQTGILFLYSFVLALIVSLPLSLIFSSRDN